MTNKTAPETDLIVAGPRRRGRPPKDGRSVAETRELLIRSGMEVLTEQGFSATGIDLVLKRIGVPKGSFYHFFDSKEAFVHAVVERYGAYFQQLLERCFQRDDMTPLQQLNRFIEGAADNMARFEFRRGCLVGNLGQEAGQLPESLRQPLLDILARWEVAVADCLQRAQQQQQIAVTLDCLQLAQLFWVGWEGAVMRAKLARSDAPLWLYRDWFFDSLKIE
ncbi:TetR/AcrR family transcriptional regulator [Oceanobacter mangrovi]|uniref:acrylate utilization transcriptional regulator AcuR n=1 Tax=Oceanobacter mangrovi TaxID=2862510 RepID=UPI001FEAD78D|nr:TetR/AcrR family transcriptional regulator [Oceanobacter mangrovi]